MGIDSKIVRQLPGSEAALRELIDQLEVREEQPKAVRGRKVTWMQHVALRTGLSVEHPGGGHCNAEICLRKLSEFGAKALYGGYLHTGTFCRVALKPIAGPVLTLPGSIVKCDHVSGTVHDIEIAFYGEEVPIDLRRFVRSNEELARFVGANSKVSAITGTALTIEQSGVYASLIADIVKETQITFVQRRNVAEAFDLLESAQADVVLLDVVAGTPQAAVDSITSVRELGYYGSLIILVDAELRRNAAVTRLADAVLRKPIDVSCVLGTISHWIERSPTRERQKAVRSRLADNSAMTATLERVIKLIAEQTERLHVATSISDMEMATVSCREIASLAGSFGFEELEQAASSTLRSLNASCSIPESIRHIRLLESLADRLSAAAA